MGANFTGSVLVGGALHELTHAMGRVPGASGLSLVRYTSQGNHLFTNGTPAAASYFSIDGGVTKLADFGVSSDPSDFLNSPSSNLTPNDPFDETIAGSTLTSADLIMMDVLGFNVTSSPPPPGSQDVFFAPGQPIHVLTTTTGNNLPAPVGGQFNLELIINATGTGSYSTAPGYQGVAIISADSHTLTLLHGDYGVVDTGGQQLIIAGDGSESVGGASGDTILGGSGPNQFLDGHVGHQSITGGSGGNETIWGALTDTVRGGSGGNGTIAGVPGETIIGSSGANVFINATSGSESVQGGNAGNDSIWTAAGDTIHGGSNNATIGGVAGVTLLGGNGGNEFIDGAAGHQSITGGSGGNETIWGALTDTIHGGSGGNETIGGVSGETILGGAANTFINATGGSDSILAGTGNTTIWGGAHDTVQGISGGGSGLIGFAGGNETFWDDGATTGRQDSISTFNQAAGDRVSLNAATDDPNTVILTATNNGGNAVLHLHDGSSITLIGVTPLMLNSGYFTTH
jgi:Ca2+-binding RTX toxin-like protein